MKVPYTNITLAHGVAVDSAGKCPLHKVKFPRKKKWFTAARKGGFKHITYEEADATL